MPNRRQNHVEIQPGEEGVDQRNPELREHHALERGGETGGMPRDLFGEWAALVRMCGLLHGEQRADDHAHEHVDHRATDAAPGELQRSRVRPQPFGDRAPQGFRVFGYVCLQSGRENGARILDDLRHFLHEQRDALTRIAHQRHNSDANADERGDHGRGEQRDGEYARAIAAERAQPQPRCEDIDQFENQQAGEQPRQQVKLDDEAERQRNNDPGRDVRARDGEMGTFLIYCNNPEVPNRHRSGGLLR